MELLQKLPLEVFYKKKVFLKFSLNSLESTCVGVSFLISYRPEACDFIKKDSGTSVFLWILLNFQEYVFYTKYNRATASAFREQS